MRSGGVDSSVRRHAAGCMVAAGSFACTTAGGAVQGGVLGTGTSCRSSWGAATALHSAQQSSQHGWTAVAHACAKAVPAANSHSSSTMAARRGKWRGRLNMVEICCGPILGGPATSRLMIIKPSRPLAALKPTPGLQIRYVAALAAFTWPCRRKGGMRCSPVVFSKFLSADPLLWIGRAG